MVSKVHMNLISSIITIIYSHDTRFLYLTINQPTITYVRTSIYLNNIFSPSHLSPNLRYFHQSVLTTQKCCLFSFYLIKIVFFETSKINNLKLLHGQELLIMFNSFNVLLFTVGQLIKSEIEIYCYNQMVVNMEMFSPLGCRQRHLIWIINNIL